MSASNGTTPPPPDLRSLTYRDGDRVLVRRYNPEPTHAERMRRSFCPAGHAAARLDGTCPRCGTVV